MGKKTKVAQPPPGVAARQKQGNTTPFVYMGAAGIVLVGVGLAMLYFPPFDSDSSSTSEGVLLVQRGAADESTGEFFVVFFPNGGNVGPLRDQIVTITLDPRVASLRGVADHAWEAFGGDGRYKVFNGSGIETKSLFGVRSGEHLYLVASTDHFFWPPVVIGHTAPLTGVESGTGRQLYITTASDQPRVFTIEHFLSDQECDSIIARAKPSLERSGVYEHGGKKQGSHTHYNDVRTSEQTWLYDDDANSKFIRRRVEQLTKVPRSCHEKAVQVVHYGPQQHYYSHYDYFDRTIYVDRPDLQAGRNRMITVFFYLNDVPEGGETVFPYGGDDHYALHNYINFSDCSRGLRVRPRKGAAVMFYSLESKGHMQGELDLYSLHGGCDVHEGEKWGVNLWVYNMPGDKWGQ